MTTSREQSAELARLGVRIRHGYRRVDELRAELTARGDPPPYLSRVDRATDR